MVNLDDIVTIERRLLGSLVGYLLDDQERALHTAVVRAFDLEDQAGEGESSSIDVGMPEVP